MGVGVRVVWDEKKRTHLLWRLNERLCLEKFWSSFYNADEPYLALEELEWFNSYCLTQLSHLLCGRVSLHPKLSKSCARTGGRGTIPLVVLLSSSSLHLTGITRCAFIFSVLPSCAVLYGHRIRYYWSWTYPFTRHVCTIATQYNYFYPKGQAEGTKRMVIK